MAWSICIFWLNIKTLECIIKTQGGEKNGTWRENKEG